MKPKLLTTDGRSCGNNKHILSGMVRDVCHLIRPDTGWKRLGV